MSDANRLNQDPVQSQFCPKCGASIERPRPSAPQEARPLSGHPETGAPTENASPRARVSEIVARAVVVRKPGLIYFIDREGNACAAPMRRRGRRRRQLRPSSGVRKRVLR
jgi:hypothetical protein